MKCLFPKGEGSAALRRGRLSIAGHAYLVTFTTCDRLPLFREFAAAHAGARAMHETSTEQGARTLAWVLMPDHCHAIVVLGQRESLSRWVGRVKWAMSRAYQTSTGETRRVWAKGFHDHALRADEDARNASRYVILNPVRAGLVRRALDYPYWNAAWL
jgi:REP element-mobilizing transposase RayT